MFSTRKPSFWLEINRWNPFQYRYVVLCNFIRLPKAEGEDCTLGGSKERDVDRCTSSPSAHRLWPPFCLSFKMTDVWLTGLIQSPPCKDNIYSVTYSASSFTQIHSNLLWYLMICTSIRRYTEALKQTEA